MAAGRGAITGKDVFQGVKEEAQEINKEMERLLASFDALKKTVKGSQYMKQAYAAEKQYLQLQKEMERVEQQKIVTQQKLQRLEAAESAAKAAKNREAKTEVQLSAAIAREQERQARSTNKVAGAYAKASKALNSMRNEYKDLLLKKKQGIKLTEQEAAKFKSLGSAVKKLDRDLKGVDAAVGQYQRNVGNYASALGGVFKGFKSFLGAFGITTGIFAFAAVMKDAFRVVKEFDQAQADLAAILGKNKKDIGALSDQAKELGATTAFTAIQVSNLQLELSKLGFNETEILAATKGVEDLAIATGVEAARAAKLAGASLRGFGLDAAEANRVAGVLAVSTTKSASSFQTLEIALPKVAAIANSLNFEIEDTAALLGALQNAGFEASISGTSLRQILAALADESGGLQQALGGNVKDFDSFVAGLKKLNERGIELNEVLKLVPVRAAAALQVLIQNNQDLSNLKEELADVSGELEKLAETKLDSVSGDLILAKSAWEGFVQAIEDGKGPIAGAIRSVIQSVTDLLTMLREAEATVDERSGKSTRNAAQDAFDYEIKLIKDDARIEGKDVKEIAERLYEGYASAYDQANAKLEEKRKEIERLQAIADSADGGFLGLFNVEGSAKRIGAETQIKMLTQEYINLSASAGDAEGRLRAVNQILGKNTDETKKNVKETRGIIEVLQEDLKELNEQRNKATSISEINSLNAQIKAKEERLKQLLGSEKSFREGTLAYFDQQIKDLQKEQKEVAITAEKYAALQKQIEDYRDKKDMLESAGNLAGLYPKGTVGTGFDTSREIAVEDLKSNSDKALSEVERMNDARINGQKIVEEYIKESEQKIRDSVAGTFEQFAKFYGVDLQQFKGLYDGKENTLEDYVSAVQESVRFVAGAVLEGYEREREGNREKLDAILSAEDATEEQKRIAKQKFEEEDRKLKRKQFKAEQDALTFQVAIDTAAAVAKILLQAGIFTAGGPITAGLAANAYAQAGIATAMGAAQIAFIKSQKPPEFFQGKDKWNRFEGMATWGERRPEVLIDKDGKFQVSPNKRTPLFVRQDDLIVPSVAQFERELMTPGSEVHRRVASQVRRDTEERSRMHFESKVDLAPLRGLLQDEIRRGFKGARININNQFPSTRRIDQY